MLISGYNCNLERRIKMIFKRLLSVGLIAVLTFTVSVPIFASEEMTEPEKFILRRQKKNVMQSLKSRCKKS